MPSGTSDAPPNYPSNSGDYGNKDFSSANDAQRVVGLGNETETVLVVAPPGNSGIIYIGFDDEVTTSNGVPLEAGAGLSFDVDANELGVFAVADTANDSLRYLFVS